MESVTTEMQALMKTQDFPQKIERQLVLQSHNVKNPYKFLSGLFTEGVLSDESSDQEASSGLKEKMVQLAVTIACSKGPDAIGGLIKALEGSGNILLISALDTWAKEDFGIETYGELCEPQEGASAMPSPATKKPQNFTPEASSTGIKLIDNITSRVEDHFMEQLESYLVGKTSEIVQATEFYTSLIHQSVLEEPDIQLKTGLEVNEVQLTEEAIKAACSKKAIGSLVIALERSNNERILVETYDWLKTSQARKKNYPIAVKSLPNKQKPTATGLFAATTTGLISLDLQTLDATVLTSEHTLAVAVNHSLKKLYWSEGFLDSRIMRSDFDGSAEEVIVSPTGRSIYMLAIDEASGNVYYGLFCSRSHEINVCNELGENCATIIIDSSLVSYMVGMALDSTKGVMYFGSGESSCRYLVRANLDGSNATVISFEFDDLHGITLDPFSTGVLYWVDLEEHTIGAIDVHSGIKRTIIELKTYSRPWGIQVDASKIYFSTVEGGNIQSVDRDSGKGLKTIFKSTGAITNLALFEATVKDS